jgi:hypothetical protein
MIYRFFWKRVGRFFAAILISKKVSYYEKTGRAGIFFWKFTMKINGVVLELSLDMFSSKLLATFF